MPFFRPLLMLVLLAIGQNVPAASRMDPSPFGPSERVVFLGDSITFDGLYVTYTEAMLRMRHPRTDWRIYNLGRPGQTLHELIASKPSPEGTDEKDWFVHEVAALNPTLIFAFFGMFDGGFGPPDQERLAQFQNNIHTLIQRVRKETNARLVLLTPSVFDNPSRQIKEGNREKNYSSRIPDPAYDKVLESQAAWMVKCAPNWAGVKVIDVHSAMHRHLTARRREDADYTLQPGRIRPNATGHMVIASTIASSIGLNPHAAPCEINLAQGKQQGDVTGMTTNKSGLSFDWQAPLPLIPDPRWDDASTRIEGLTVEQSGATLCIHGLVQGEYTLSADDRVVAFCNASELSAGIHIGLLGEFPTVRRSKNLLEYLDERRRLEQQLKLQMEMKNSERDAELKRAEAINQRLHDLSQPQHLRIQIQRR